MGNPIDEQEEIQKNRCFLEETILAMHGYKPDEIGSWQCFDEKKEKIRELLNVCDIENEEIKRRKGLIELVLTRRQKLQFYLVEKDDHTFGLPDNCNLNEPESFETLMLFDELMSVLEEIYQQSLQNNSMFELDENLKRILSLLNETTYERLDQVLGCLLILTEK